MFQGCEVNGSQHKYKEESNGDKTTKKVRTYIRTGGHGEENFISNDL